MQTVTVQNVKIKEPSEIKFLLHEVGWECIEAIKAHLIEMEGPVDFDDQHVREIIGDRLLELKSVRSLSLNEEGEILAFMSSQRSRKLSSMLMDDTIKVDELFSILKAIHALK